MYIGKHQRRELGILPGTWRSPVLAQRRHIWGLLQIFLPSPYTLEMEEERATDERGSFNPPLRAETEGPQQVW